MLSSALRTHILRLAQLYSHAEPGRPLKSAESGRTAGASALLEEMRDGRSQIRDHIHELTRSTPVSVHVGRPQGAWAYVYYVSFHDGRNSEGPTQGFYPVFLLSVDRKRCWLAVGLAAASVGISGRGGWSKKRGAQLRRRAALLGSVLSVPDGWQLGPIALGANGAFLHDDSGNGRSAGKAYECGSIIAKSFDPNDPPSDLAAWLLQAYVFNDAIFKEEREYIRFSVPQVGESERREQVAACILGEVAERHVLTSWCSETRPDWGSPVDRTDRVGLGFDVEFPAVGLVMEIKGFRGPIDAVRLTPTEWEVARERGPSYLLALVSHLEGPGSPQVRLIIDPYAKLNAWADYRQRVQVDVTIPAARLLSVAGQPVPTRASIGGSSQPPA